MRKSDRRQKASDLFREGSYVFATPAKFAEVFPDIEDVTVDVTESGYGAREGRRSLYTRQDLPGEYIDCSNPVCHNGGFSIGSVLREMARDHLTELQVSKFCQGNEGSPKGRRIYRKWLNGFEVKVVIKYKGENDP